MFPTAEAKPVKSAARVLDILELLARSDNPLTLSEVSGTLSLPKSSTYLLLQTLARRGYVESASGVGTFRLGMRVMELAGAYSSKADLLQQFRPVARQLVAACEETVQLAVLDGVEVVYLAKEDGTRPVRLVSHVGKRLPAHATALGKVLLAALPDSELAARLSHGPLAQMTPWTIVTFDHLMRELAQVRALGYAVDREEVVEDLYCFAAPVHNQGGRVIAAISVSIPKSRVAEEDFLRHIRLIGEAGTELSHRMGYLGPLENRTDSAGYESAPGSSSGSLVS